MMEDPLPQSLFPTFGLGALQQNLEETRKLSGGEREYLQWLYRADRARSTFTLRCLDTVEYYLGIVSFPVVLIIRSDIPSLCDHLRKRVSVKMEALKPGWVDIPCFNRQREECERLWSFWQSQFALDAANGHERHAEKLFLKLVGS